MLIYNAIIYKHNPIIKNDQEQQKEAPELETLLYANFQA